MYERFHSLFCPQVIRPCGPEFKHPDLTDQEFMDWEQRELSFLRGKCKTNENNNYNKIEQPKRRMQGVRDDSDSHDKSMSKVEHNLMERMRRSELNELMANLARQVLPEDKPFQMAKIRILTRVSNTCTYTYIYSFTNNTIVS